MLLLKILITIDENYKPHNKDAFDDVWLALDYFDILAEIVEVKEAKEDN